ncbi:Mucin-associated surface protein (MASP), subgroup S037 [Trypanosoma cruzi]|nr:Mucin-associated surface protein (MASP), subgroup S037 [Trypanosoma cruzi]
MAMMMTGRVLLVCALCVLWCGVGGRCDEDKAGSGIDAELPPAPVPLETSQQDPQDLKNGVPGVKGTASLASSPPKDGDADGETEDQEESIEGQSGEKGNVALGSDSRERNLIGSGQETGQSIAPAGDISPSGSQESNANPTQTKIEGNKSADKNSPSAEKALTTVNGENTLPGEIAEGNLPSPPEEDVASREQDGEDTTSEGEKNVPPPETAATPQSHRDKGSEGTEEDAKATTVTANTTDTTTGDSDGSTAVLHTTSPLLLLLVVACAAAAAVVAA